MDFDENNDGSTRLEAIQKLKELMKQLELEQHLPKSLKAQEVEAERPETEEPGIEDEEELLKILGG